MKTYTDWLREWLYEGKRALPLLHEWLDALVARDATRIDAVNARLTPILERLEQARQAVAQIPERDALPTELLQQRWRPRTPSTPSPKPPTTSSATNWTTHAA